MGQTRVGPHLDWVGLFHTSGHLCGLWAESPDLFVPLLSVVPFNRFPFSASPLSVFALLNKDGLLSLACWGGALALTFNDP